jgi:glycosyltransferase involved in cell wall biosynthesis
VIIPVFNEAAKLDRCLASVLNQTYKNLEIIIVDDASTDRSRDIIRRFEKEDARIKPQFLTKNSGQGSARNVGLGAAAGVYIFFLDSDDYLPADALETLADIAGEYGSDIVIGKTCSEIDVDGTYIDGEYRNIGITDHASLLYNHSVWNKIIKKELLDKNSIDFEQPRHAEDVLFSLKTNMSASTISITRSVTYNYNWSRQAENVSSEKVIGGRECIRLAYQLALSHGDPRIHEEMAVKTARLSYSTMVRATGALDRVELHAHLVEWRKILESLPNGIFKRLPGKYKRFVSFLLAGEYDEAVNHWRKTERFYKNPLIRVLGRIALLLKSGSNGRLI